MSLIVNALLANNNETIMKLFEAQKDVREYRRKVQHEAKSRAGVDEKLGRSEVAANQTSKARVVKSHPVQVAHSSAHASEQTRDLAAKAAKDTVDSRSEAAIPEKSASDTKSEPKSALATKTELKSSPPISGVAETKANSAAPVSNVDMEDRL